MATRFSITPKTPQELQLACLPQETQQAFLYCTTTPLFSQDTLERNLFVTGHWHTSLRAQGTLYGTLKGAKISFIAYPFFQPSPHRIVCGHVPILLPPDIASMKIIAMSQRGKKRDFVDLYWFLHHGERLTSLIARTLEQYPNKEHNVPHILKSLTYFADAEQDPMPELYFKIDWPTIKAYFCREVPRVTHELLQLP